jgi:hypothetical protein
MAAETAAYVDEGNDRYLLRLAGAAPTICMVEP